MNTELSDKDVEIVCGILIEHLDVQRSQIFADAKIKHDLGADSLDEMNIAMDVEEHFSVVIPDTETEKIVTVGDLCNVVAQALQQVKE